MLNRCVPLSLRNSFGLIVARHLSLSANLAQQSKQQQATDPIQQLFVNKIREYNEKRKSVILMERIIFIFCCCLDKQKMVLLMPHLKYERVWKMP